VFRRMLGIGVDSGVGAATGDVTHLPPWRPTRLSEPTTAKAARELFRAATIEPDGRARVIAWHGSGDLAHTSVATGFVRLPQVDRDITVDEPVMFLPML